MSSQNPEPPTVQTDETQVEFWRRTPPALFPTLMGLLGLGLAWRAAAQSGILSITPWISYVLLAFASVLLLFVLACYLSKISVRLGVILEDLRSVPGRAGVSAMGVSLLLFSSAMVPLSPLVATATLFMGLIWHSAVAALIIFVMVRTPQGLVISPAWHLSFVGFIVACLSAVPLGYVALSQTILGATVLMSSLIYGVSLLQLSKAEVPEPLRPMQVIHLAPLSLFTTVSVLLGHALLALIFGTLAIGLAGVLITRVRYLTRAGFSPLWGAFTFPVAAFSVALFALSAQIGLFAWLALVPLALASVIVPIIALRVLRMWSTGALATKTGAAVA
ncbi:tellurium resistance protein [Planktotalea sp.]|uniref:SLAC1 family transporter n=1 Tax=Planktotalea sp. TaxID=2029877 RepID=UPI003D6B413E